MGEVRLKQISSSLNWGVSTKNATLAALTDGPLITSSCAQYAYQKNERRFCS